MRTIKLSDASPDVVELVEEAAEARKFAYCPYSKFAVGSAVRTSTNTIFKGCNVENSGYSACICAERTAIVKAVSEGQREFKAVAVCAVHRDEFVAPCGLCRQFIAEWGTNIDIYLVKEDLKEVLISDISEMLPLSFHL